MSGNQEEVDGKSVDQIAKIAGPVGGLWVAYNDQGISGASFANLTTFARFREEHHDRTGRPSARPDAMPDDLFDAIENSFNTGDRSDLAFDLRGATYADMARSIRRPNAVRAVGTALGANPIPVLIPCHRVLRSDGSLGGYAFGLPIKERLLDREAVRAAA